MTDHVFTSKLAEVKHLLAEAYEHYFEYGDGCCKSSEGAISVHLTQPFYWREGDGEPGIEIYSYVFGSGRHHYYASIDHALTEVREWHRAEMATEYDEHGDPVGTWDE